MTDIEQEASDEFKRREAEGIMFPSPANAFAQGYITGASRPAPPATREAVARVVDPNALELDAYPWPLDAADRLLAAFDIRERIE